MTHVLKESHFLLGYFLSTESKLFAKVFWIFVYYIRVWVDEVELKNLGFVAQWATSPKFFGNAHER